VNPCCFPDLSAEEQLNITVIPVAKPEGDFGQNCSLKEFGSICCQSSHRDPFRRHVTSVSPLREKMRLATHSAALRAGFVELLAMTELDDAAYRTAATPRSKAE
jgi:hypothetical protein